MAFPTTATLDDFNTGALQNLTSRAGWSASTLRTGDATLATDAVPTVATAASTAGNLWNDPAVQNSESFLTIGAYTPASQQIYLCTRVTIQGTLTSYCLQIGAPTTTFVLLKFLAGAGTVVSASIATTCATGDSIGISVSGNVLNTWYKAGAGAWVNKHVNIVDNNITANGKYGGVFCSASVSIDSIGGGALPNSSSLRFLPLTGVGT